MPVVRQKRRKGLPIYTYRSVDYTTDLRNSNHGGAGCRRGWHLEYSAHDKEARHHGQPAPYEQGSATDPFSRVKADGDKGDEHRIDGDGSEERLGQSGLLEKVRRVRKDDRRAGPQLVLERHDGNDGPAQIGPPETVEKRDVFLLVGKDPAVFNLFHNDGILVIDIIVWYRPVDPFEVALALVVLAADGIEARRLGNDGEYDGCETDKEPHRVDGMAPLVDGHGRDDLQTYGGGE